jgi:glycosyltransferase involved in cell wall biosynthesis
MKSLLVEGWRGISHSYALVNENQMVWMKRHAIALSHLDAPFADPTWNSKISASGLPVQNEMVLSTIPAPAVGQTFDVTYRISFPYNFNPIENGALFVFGTSEFHSLDGMILGDNHKAALLNPSTQVITPSPWSATGFLKSGFDASRVHVVPHGVNAEVFKPHPDEMRNRTRKKHKLDKEDFVILSLGAMTPNKGVDLLVVAFAILYKKHKHLRLVLKDQNNLHGRDGASWVSSAAKTYPKLVTSDVVAAVQFSSENFDQASLAALYAAADCYVSPYRAEGFGLTPLEAAACGTPVVITKGGATDIYAHPSFALQVEGKMQSKGNASWIEPDIDALVAAIESLVKRRATQINRRFAVKHIQQNFSWKTVTDQLLITMGLA